MDSGRGRDADAHEGFLNLLFQNHLPPPATTIDDLFPAADIDLGKPYETEPYFAYVCVQIWPCVCIWGSIDDALMTVKGGNINGDGQQLGPAAALAAAPQTHIAAVPEFDVAINSWPMDNMHDHAYSDNQQLFSFTRLLLQGGDDRDMYLNSDFTWTLGPAPDTSTPMAWAPPHHITHNATPPCRWGATGRRTSSRGMDRRHLLDAYVARCKKISSQNYKSAAAQMHDHDDLGPEEPSACAAAVDVDDDDEDENDDGDEEEEEIVGAEDHDDDDDSDYVPPAEETDREGNTSRKLKRKRSRNCGPRLTKKKCAPRHSQVWMQPGRSEGLPLCAKLKAMLDGHYRVIETAPISWDRRPFKRKQRRRPNYSRIT